jgi:hypothetical protein
VAVRIVGPSASGTEALKFPFASTGAREWN